MHPNEFPDSLAHESDSKIVYFILDGIGDLPTGPGGLTPLEAAQTPHLDALCDGGICGLLDPIQPGVTPGSGPGHLSLFGYDPAETWAGRGILSALGLDFPIRPDDVAVRMNFATRDRAGNITDRRAGRIDDETNRRLVDILNEGGESVHLEEVECFVRSEKEHRALAVFRRRGLSADMFDTDPQTLGVPPLPARARSSKAERTAKAVAAFIDRAHQLLADEPRANTVLLRGFDTLPNLPTLADRYRLRSYAIAYYPMYKGLAKLVGMEVDAGSSDPREQVQIAIRNWEGHDFFYVHLKATDLFGENGDFDGKKTAIETVDAALPPLVDWMFGGDSDGPCHVLIVTGDHSTPVSMKAHSWHPVPALIRSHRVRADGQKTFGERSCQTGGLGRIPMRHLMAIALANAGRLSKYGA